MSVLLDGEPGGRELAPAEPRRLDRPRRQLGLLARSVIGLPRQQVAQVTAARRALPHVDRIPQARSVPGAKTAGSLTRSVLRDRSGDDAVSAPRMRFNAEISPRRRLELVSLSLSDVKRLKRTFGTTVNDVVVAVRAGALRTWLDAAGELPEGPLVAMVPVSIRSADEAGTFGNAVAAMVAALPTDVADPRVRLESCRDEMRRAKEQFGATPASLMRDANDMLPPVLFGPAMRTVLRLGTSRIAEPVANLVISNVPGSASPLYCSGAEVVAQYPVSTLADSLGLNITLFSYQDRLDVGLIADPDLVPELSSLGDALVDELARLVELGDQQEGARS
jgi:WS/DGAT/MGAT family acyltransferase